MHICVMVDTATGKSNAPKYKLQIFITCILAVLLTLGVWLWYSYKIDKLEENQLYLQLDKD